MGISILKLNAGMQVTWNYKDRLMLSFKWWVMISRTSRHLPRFPVPNLITTTTATVATTTSIVAAVATVAIKTKTTEKNNSYRSSYKNNNKNISSYKNNYNNISSYNNSCNNNKVIIYTKGTIISCLCCNHVLVLFAIKIIWNLTLETGTVFYYMKSTHVMLNWAC